MLENKTEAEKFFVFNQLHFFCIMIKLSVRQGPVYYELKKKTNIKTSKCFILKTYIRVLKAYKHNYINIERDTHVLTYII